MDYYKELESDPKTATPTSINSAFRRLALKHHPIKNRDTIAQSQTKFNSICEAYEVLSHPTYKAVYDKYGLSGLNNGVKEEGPDALSHGGYHFNGDSYAVFLRVFGTKNPYGENFMDPSEIRLVPEQPKGEHDPKDITVSLSCTITEFYNGSLKTF